MFHGMIKKCTVAVITGMLGSVLFVASVAAAAEANGIGEVQTREIKVTATRTEKDLLEVPMSVGVVTGGDQAGNPQTNVAEMLARIPGVTVMDGGMPGGKRVMIRGESPMRSLLLINGIKVSEQKSMSGSAILLDSSQIERIEVIKGPASVLYGSEALGGVINIITKKGGDKPIGFSQEVVFDSSNDSWDLQSALYGSYNGFNYRFTASGINAHDLHGADDTVRNSRYKNRYYSGQVGYDWDKGNVFLRADRYESRINIPTNYASGVIRHGSNAGMNNLTAVSLDLPKWDRESVSGGFEVREINDYLAKIKLNGFAQNMEKQFRNSVDVHNWTTTPMGSMIVDVVQNIETINDQDSYGGSLQTEWNFGGNHYVVAGLDYNLDKLDAKDNRLGGYTYIQPPMGSPTMRPSAPAYYRYKVQQQTLGAFIQDDWTFLPGWTATLGLRETWVNSELQSNDNPNLANNGDKNDSKLVGNLGLVYSGIKDVALRASWSQGYRFPALNQLYLGTVHGQTGNTLPNPDLSPETSNSFEIGARVAKKSWNFDVAAFYTDSRDYITTQDLNDGSGDSIFANIDKSRTFGLELAVDYTFSDWNLTPYASATWLNRRYENHITDINGNSVSYKTNRTGTPALQGVLGIRWQHELAKDLVLFTDAYSRVAAKAKSYSYDSTYSGDFQTTREGGWGTLNFTTGIEGKGDYKWHLTLSLRNLLNKNYTQASNTIEDPGFHAVIATGIQF